MKKLFGCFLCVMLLMIGAFYLALEELVAIRTREPMRGLKREILSTLLRMSNFHFGSVSHSLGTFLTPHKAVEMGNHRHIPE